MKIIVTLVLILYFISCKDSPNTHNGDDSKENKVSWLDETYDINELPFTITHRGMGGKDIFIFLKKTTLEGESLNTLLDYKNPPLYRLKPYECLQVTMSQFEYLIIIEELPDKLRDAGLTKNKILCGNAKKCEPSHYQVINNVFFNESYIINPVSYPNLNENCPNIVTWMKTKNSLSGNEQENNPVGNESTFTITHKSNDNEPVIIYLQNKIEDEITNIYKLEPNECLQITTSQFDQLFVALGKGGKIKGGGKGRYGFIMAIIKGLGLGVKNICSSELKKCIPGHYEINDTGDLFDEYAMVKVNNPDTHDTCTGIEQWMKNKNKNV